MPDTPMTADEQQRLWAELRVLQRKLIEIHGRIRELEDRLARAAARSGAQPP